MSRLRSAMRQSRVVVDNLRHLVGWHESESKLARDSQAYWEAPPNGRAELVAHWREGFADPDAWLGLGREHFTLYEKFARSAAFARPAQRVVEWGCGGGANAVHFGREAEAFYGVDITRASLDECGRQMKAEGLDCFRPVLVETLAPETALDEVPHDCDLFTSFYVFELLPTPEYGLRILDIGHRMLRPGGMAIIQIKYPTSVWGHSRRWGYRFGMANMTKYEIPEFWRHAAQVGFDIHAITLTPRAAQVNDGPYAYFVLIKRAPTGLSVS